MYSSCWNSSPFVFLPRPSRSVAAAVTVTARPKDMLPPPHRSPIHAWTGDAALIHCWGHKHSKLPYQHEERSAYPNHKLYNKLPLPKMLWPTSPLRGQHPDFTALPLPQLPPSVHPPIPRQFPPSRLPPNCQYLPCPHAALQPRLK